MACVRGKYGSSEGALEAEQQRSEGPARCHPNGLLLMGLNSRAGTRFDFNSLHFTNQSFKSSNLLSLCLFERDMDCRSAYDSRFC